MRTNGPLALIFHTIFVVVMLAPIVVVCLVAFTPEGYLSLPTTSFSLRWFRKIANYPEFVHAFWVSLGLGALSSLVALLFAVAAGSLGAGGWTLFRRVTLPLILPGVISGWALAFIQSFDDLTMTVFLATPGTETRPVRMFLYIQDNIDPLVTSVSASVIAITM